MGYNFTLGNSLKSRKKLLHLCSWLLLFIAFLSSTSFAAVDESLWKLSSGEFIPAKIPMHVVYPRPDDETSIHARHKFAHPDMPYEIPIGIQGGSWPFSYEILSGPSGASIGTIPRTEEYGVVSWNPPSSGTYTFVVRVTDQEYNIIDVNWSVTVDASKFVFIEDGYSGTKVGTITQPLEDISDWYKGDASDNTYHDKIIVFRGGEYELIGSSANNYNVRLEEDSKTRTLIGYPGETAVIDASKAKIMVQSNMDDIFVADLTFTNGRQDVANAHYFWVTGVSNRASWWRNHFTNLGPGTAGNDNTGTVFLSKTTAYKQNILYSDNLLTNISNRNGGNGHYVDLYDTDYVIVEGNRGENSETGYGLWMKYTGRYVTIRDNFFSNTIGYQIAIGNTIADYSGYNEVSYNTIKTDDTAGIFLASMENVGTTTNNYFYRNTFAGGGATILRFRGNEDYMTDGNVITAYNTQSLNSWDEDISTSIHEPNLLLLSSTQAVDSQGRLAGTYTQYYGKKGAEINLNSSGGGVSNDSESPTAPANLNSPSQTVDSISLSWSASTDNVGVIGYRVFRDGSLVGTITGTNYNGTGLNANTTYSYYVQAYDGASNTANSTTLSVSTLAEQSGGEENISVVDNNISLTVRVDSTYNDNAYDLSHLIDGDIQTEWASAQNISNPNWVELEFNTSMNLSSLTIYWGDNNGNYYMQPETLQIQYFDGSAFQTFTTIGGSNDVPSSIINVSAMPSTKILRLYQAAGEGNVKYASVLWLAEIVVVSDDNESQSNNSEDTQAPSQVSGLVASEVTSSNVGLTWLAASDNVGVVNYEIERCTGSGCSNFVLIGNTGSLSFEDTTVAASISYRYRVRAIDASGNNGSYSSIVGITTEASQTEVDTTPPSQVMGLTNTSLTGSSVTLSWSAASDNVGVSSYRIYRCSGQECTPTSQIGISTNPVYVDSTVTEQSFYSYSVQAYDAAGNQGPMSFYLDILTPDVSPALLSGGSPSGQLAAGTSQITLQVTSNEAATCRYSPVSGTSYSTMIPFSSTGAFSHSTLVSGLSDGQSYSYYVKCSDSSGNRNPDDYQISFSVGSVPSCHLSSASWSSLLAQDGEEVEAIVSGTNCDGKSLTITIYEDDLLDTTVMTLSTQFSGNQALASWISEWECDGNLFGICTAGNPEYYFVAVLSENVSSSISSGTDSPSELVVTSSDVTAPVLYDVQVAVGSTNATVSWWTDEPSQSYLEYGLSSSYGKNTSLSSSLSDSHSVSVTALDSDTLYYYKLSSLDQSGNKGFVVGSFRTAYVDTVSPQLISTSPLNGSSNVSISSDIYFTFSEAMSVGTLSVTNDEGVAFSSSYDNASRSLKLSPAVDLEYETTYHFHLSALGTDLAGNSLGSGYDLVFTTDSFDEPGTVEVIFNASTWNMSRTTNFSALNSSELLSVGDAIFSNQYGEIAFLSPLKIERTLDLRDKISVGAGHASLDSFLLPEFNVSARLTLHNISYSKYKVQRDGVDCPSSVCSEIVANGTSLSFTVTSWSEYTIVEVSSSSTSGGSSSSSGGGGGGSSNSKKKKSSDLVELAEILGNETGTESCVSSFEYGQWSVCVNGEQSRLVTDSAACVDVETQTRACTVSGDEDSNRKLNAKKLDLQIVSSKRYQTQLSGTYTELYYVDEKLSDESFVVYDELSGKEYLSEFVEESDGNYYYSLRPVDSVVVSEVQELAAAQVAAEEQAETDEREKQKYFGQIFTPATWTVLFLILVVVGIGLIVVYLYKRRNVNEF